MGYDTDIKKDINTVRGKVNVDVFATKKAIGSVKQSLLNANNGIER